MSDGDDDDWCLARARQPDKSRDLIILSTVFSFFSEQRKCFLQVRNLDNKKTKSPCLLTAKLLKRCS